MHGVGLKIRHWKNRSNLVFGVLVNSLAEQDSRFLEIRNLAREIGELFKNVADGHGFINRGFATENQIVREKKGVDRGAAETQSNPRKVVVLQFSLKTMGKFIDGNNKKVGRQRASLPDSTLGSKGISGFTVDEDREGGHGYASMDEADEIAMIPLTTKSCRNEIPFQTVESLGKIQLQKESLLIPRF